MSNSVQRIVVKAYPTVDHPTLHPFHLHTLCIFIGENDKSKALNRVENELVKRKWRVVRYLDKGTLIKTRVEACGGEVWAAYQTAERGSIFIKAESNDNILTKDVAMAIPTLTEEVVDRAIEIAGGHRLSTQEANHSRTLNADYILGDWIVELKELKEERLLKSSHQDVLAELFEKYSCDDHIEIDFNLLSDHEKKMFLNSACSPLRRSLAKASKQIGATKSHLQKPFMKGAVIILNNGYGSLQPEVLPDIANKLAIQHSQIDLVISISQWLRSNGFDNEAQFRIEPPEAPDNSIRSFYDSLWAEIEALMTRAVMASVNESRELQRPLYPIIFKRSDKFYRFTPELPFNTMFPTQGSDKEG